MCRVDDGEQAEWSRSTTRRARKQHGCEECRFPIRPGDSYRHHAGKYEGMMFSYALCFDCTAWAKEYHRAQLRHCKGETWSWTLGSMWEDICEFVAEHLGYDPETGEEREVYHDEPAPSAGVLMETMEARP